MSATKFSIGILLLGAAAHAAAKPELFEPGLVSTMHDDAHVSFTPDGSTMYFVRGTPDFEHWTLLSSQRTGNRWGAPEVPSFAGRYSDADVFVTPAGDRLLFISNRPVDGTPKADTDIWMMTRDGARWSAPKHVAELASPTAEWYPTMTDDGWVYFGSEREGSRGASDLWRARWLGDRFSAPENLGAPVNTELQEIEPLVARDGSYIIYAAKRHDSPDTAYDLLVTYACNGTWTKPEALDALNSKGWEFGPRWSPDGRTFYFTSNRSTFLDAKRPFDHASLMKRLESPGNGLRDVYQVPAASLALSDDACDSTAHADEQTATTLTAAQ